MACSHCPPNSQEPCTHVFPVFSPCACDEPGLIQEEGPTGPTGPKGNTPHFAVGTVGSGNASITERNVGYAEEEVDWVLPAIPEGVPYTWTEVQTFAAKPVFEDGITTTGGTTTIGGVSLVVTPDVEFDQDVDIASTLTLEGNAHVITLLDDQGPITALGTASFNDLAINGVVAFGPDATFQLTDTSEYVSGRFILDACKRPNLTVVGGKNKYTKAEATGIVAFINPSDNGVICDPIVITIPASTCGPQVTPKIDIRVRVTWRMGGTPQAAFTATLWQTGVGITSLDVFTQGSAFNGNAGDFILRAQATCGLGVNNFYIDLDNIDVTESWIPIAVTYWLEN